MWLLHALISHENYIYIDYFLHKFIVEKEDFSYFIFKIFLYIELNDKKENLISTLVLFKKNDIYYSSLYIRRCDGVKYINNISKFYTYWVYKKTNDNVLSRRDYLFFVDGMFNSSRDELLYPIIWFWFWFWRSWFYNILLIKFVIILIIFVVVGNSHAFDVVDFLVWLPTWRLILSWCSLNFQVDHATKFLALVCCQIYYICVS